MSAKQVEDLAQKIYEFQYELQKIDKVDESSIKLLSGRISELKNLADECRRIFPIILDYMHSSGSPKFDLADRILAFDKEKKELQFELDESSKKLEEQVADILSLDKEVAELNKIILYQDRKINFSSEEIEKLRDEKLHLQAQLDINARSKFPHIGGVRNMKREERYADQKPHKSAVILKSTNEWVVVKDDSDFDMWTCIGRDGKVRGIKTAYLDTSSSRMVPINSEYFSSEQMQVLAGSS